MAAEGEAGSTAMPYRGALSWGTGVDSMAMDDLIGRAKQNLMLTDNAEWIDQSIAGMYFLSQQQSCMVNKYNRGHLDAPVHIDKDGAWQEAPTC